MSWSSQTEELSGGRGGESHLVLVINDCGGDIDSGPRWRGEAWSRFEDEAVGVNWPGQEDVIAGLRDGERQCKEFESHCVGFGSADTHTAVLKNLQVVSARWQLGEED